MACFLVPMTEAIVTTVATKVIASKEKKAEGAHVELKGESAQDQGRIPFSRKLKWLNGMLWGGSALLAFEHVWHGEVSPVFPFLTAMKDPAAAAEMFHEMATAGVAMAVLVTLAWLGMVGVSALIEKRALKAAGEAAK